jgi:DNA (cytosine-5)-methyltransferase 1
MNTFMAVQKSNDKPHFLDCFCGIGGLSVGFERSGFKCVGGIDSWSDAAKTFEHNHGLPCIVRGIEEVDVDAIEASFSVSKDRIDVIVGGPPCQGFSTVGKRDDTDPRNNLWKHYLELVSKVRPAYVLIENVEGMAVMNSGKVCDGIVQAFESIGYNMKWKVFRSCDFGVPQLRKRLIFFGWLEGLAEPNFPQPNAARPVTVEEAISDLPSLAAGQSSKKYGGNPKSEYQARMRCEQSELNNHEAANHPAHLVEILKHIPDGGNRKSIPDRLQPKSGFHNSYARLHSRKPAVAVTSNMRKPSSARATHPFDDRGLTVREGLRLQSFPDSFVVLGSRTSQYLQVGNAVPPLLAAAFAASIMKAFRSQTSEVIAAARRRITKPTHLKNRKESQLAFAQMAV